MTLAGLGIAAESACRNDRDPRAVTLLFGVSRLTPTYLAVVALLASVSAIACAMPAWRAARVRPSIALTAE
jgi:ABC-type antimicrobial peptide transport system permease subunit